MNDWIPEVLEAAPVRTWTLGDPMKELDRASILRFLGRHRGKLGGVMLDYGCGKFEKFEHLRYAEFIKGLGDGAVHCPWDPFNAAEWMDTIRVPADIVGGRPFASTMAKLPIREVIAHGSNIFDSAIAIQMLADSERPEQCLLEIYRLLKPGGFLVVTYTNCWREADVNDKWRFTMAGAELLVRRYTSFTIEDHVQRAKCRVANFEFNLGGGMLLRKP